MYQETGQVLGASTVIGGVALLPNTGNSALLGYVAVVAIAGGIFVLTAQLAVTAYRHLQLRK